MTPALPNQPLPDRGPDRPRTRLVRRAQNPESGAAMVEMAVLMLPLAAYVGLIFIICLGFISTSMVTQDALFVYYASHSEQPTAPAPTLPQLIVGHSSNNSSWVVQQLGGLNPFNPGNPFHIHVANFVAGIANARGDAFGHPGTPEGLARIRYATTSVAIQDVTSSRQRVEIRRYFFPQLTNLSVQATITDAQ